MKLSSYSNKQTSSKSRNSPKKTLGLILVASFSLGLGYFIGVKGEKRATRKRAKKLKVHKTMAENSVNVASNLCNVINFDSDTDSDTESEEES